MIEQAKNTLIEQTANQMKKLLSFTSDNAAASGNSVAPNDVLVSKTQNQKIGSVKDLQNLNGANQQEKSSIASLENIATDCSASSSPTELLPPNIDLLSLISSRTDAAHFLGSKSDYKKSLKPDLTILAKESISATTDVSDSINSPSIDSPIYTQLSPSTIFSNQGVANNIRNEKILKLDPLVFLTLLDSSKTNSKVDIQDPVWRRIALEHRLCFLPIDLRSPSSFQESRLSGSVNPSFPALVQKRFKKRLGIMSFQLYNFLPSPECLSNLSTLKESLMSKSEKPAQAVLVVYDDTVNEESMEGDIWAFLGALSDGMAQEMFEKRKIPNPSIQSFSATNNDSQNIQTPLVCYLEGGYEKLVEISKKFPQYINHFQRNSNDPKNNESSDGTGEPLVHPMTNLTTKSTGYNDSPVIKLPLAQDTQSSTVTPDSLETSRSATFATKATPILQSSSSTYTPYKNIQSLSIDIRVPKRDSPVKKPGGLGLKLTLKPGIGSSPSSLSSDISKTPDESPNDMAAPLDPYSTITNHILIGSDVLPSSPNASTLFSDIHVTHILNMAAEIPVNPILLNNSKLKVKWIPVYDNTEVDMDDALQQAISFIDEAVRENEANKVFVHCKAGRSRSVSAVIGYLVSKEGHTLKSAYDLLRRNRRGVSPNLGFMAALMKVEKAVHGVNSSIF